MGDNFLEEQAKNSKKRRAKAIAKAKSSKLIKRVDEIADEFTIECPAGNTLVPGDVLRCFPASLEDGVDVVRGHVLVGRIRREGGDLLRQSLQIFGSGKLRVCSFNELTGTAQAEVATE